MTLARRTLFIAASSLAAAAMVPVLASGQRLTAPKSTQWAEANGESLRYELSGNGPRTIVLLHEMTASLESWDAIAPVLAVHNRVLRYDLRGFGLSERIEGSITLDDEVQDLRALLQVLGIGGKVTLIGAAIGGAIALLYAATYPDQVEGVVAISPAAYMAPQPDRLKASLNPNAPSPASTVNISGANDPAFPTFFQKAHPDRYARYLAITRTGASGGLPSTRAVYAFGFAAVLPKIKCPVLIIATTLWMRPVASVQALADAIPKGRMVAVKTCHFATIATPELLIPILSGFLADRHADLS